MLNLRVVDADGQAHAVTSVPFRQPEDPQPERGFSCEWLPYQTGQAQKREEIKRLGAELKDALGTELANADPNASRQAPAA